ncbi:type 4a pilus biogenesis protein PilO [Psychrobium sp. nBUS_13]|jgi:type IV pilus assembly protein PilO|uniref:type 4a pilus biogenesis protein PilO n=1 Tax=Psychrobium sp. nBUS_13 TaxID=3395319 RepID=UPI003EBFB19A
MKLDLSELQSVDLDLKYSGSWPPLVKGIAYLVVFVMTLVLAYFVVLSGQLDSLSNGAEQDEKLRYDYESKYRLAYNLEAYQEQMLELEVQLAEMLKKLPATHETPGMLDDITFIATSSGLRISTIKWGNEVEQEFYTELPLFIDVSGDYHQFGKFVSDVAKLPRIVSLHEFSIKKAASGQLAFHIVAKTYRYKGK